jgi:hypothetical protein
LLSGRLYYLFVVLPSFPNLILVPVGEKTFCSVTFEFGHMTSDLVLVPFKANIK